MKVFELEQRSADWYRARLALPSASEVDRIITPKTGKRSAQARGYMDDLMAEWRTGKPKHTPSSPWMERGHELEMEAWEYYELQYEVDVVRGGWITDDAGSIGASPDGRVYDAGKLVGGIELKCPASGRHYGYQQRPDELLLAYRHQVLTTLWLTGCEWWDLMSYDPGQPAAIVRVTRDTCREYYDALVEAVAGFVEDLEGEKQARLAEGETPGTFSMLYTEDEEVWT